VSYCKCHGEIQNVFSHVLLHFTLQLFILTAFQLLRKQHINLNPLCDHQPTEFLANIECVVDDLKDPAWISLFLFELQEDSVVQSMYKEYYAHLDQLPGTLDNKVCVFLLLFSILNIVRSIYLYFFILLNVKAIPVTGCYYFQF
jgi:hypothetical protein